MTMTQIDLADAKPEEWEIFCAAIIQRAASDHLAGSSDYPTGKKLCATYAAGNRVFHRRLASTIYRQMRYSMELRDNDAATEGGA